MKNLTLLTYTHSKCVDLHAAYFGRIKQYFPTLENSIVTCNTYVEHAKCVVYDDASKYSEQIITALDTIQTDYVIYSQEDYILYNHVNTVKLAEYVDIMDADPSVGFIRLIKSGVGNIAENYNGELWLIDPMSDYYFSTQATLWRRSVLRKMFELSKVSSIFEEPINSPTLRDMSVLGLYSVNVGQRVGGHWDSIVYPYIATAKVKGAWNIFEYPNELNKLFNEYNIK